MNAKPGRGKGCLQIISLFNFNFVGVDFFVELKFLKKSFSYLILWVNL